MDHQKYRTYTHALGIYLYLLDLERLSVLWSEGSMTQIIGFDPVSEGMHPADFAENYYHPRDRSLMRERISRFQSGELKCWSGIYRIRHVEGHWVWIYSKLNGVENHFNNTPPQLAGMITQANAGLQTEEQLNILIREAARLKNNRKLKSLTPREISVIKLIARGNSYTQIGNQLHIQPDTVNKHRKNILRKLQCKNIATLICFAKETGIV